jgi:ABC-2 type transport system ATP-binding protein
VSNVLAIEVENLSFAYGERLALNRVSVDVHRGAIFGFLGPNGGGKTTLFSILTTLLPVQDGEVSVLGFDLQKQGSEYRQQIGVAFQTPSLDRRLTVLENLNSQGCLYGISGRTLDDRTSELLGRFGIADRSNDIVDTLSGGLKRRAELAKCLLHRPSLLLLDEPSTGLDPGARHDLWRVLEELRSNDGVTIAVTTHLMEEAERCDSLALLDRGQIVAQGSPSKLRGELPGEQITIVADHPELLAARVSESLGISVQRIGETLRIQSLEGQRVVQGILDEFGADVRSISLGRLTLEDVFMQKTGRRFSEDHPHE